MLGKTTSQEVTANEDDEAAQVNRRKQKKREARLTVLVIPTDCQVSSSTRCDILADSYLGLQILLGFHVHKRVRAYLEHLVARQTLLTA